MPINPQALASAFWVLLVLLFILPGPPKGPSAQMVAEQLEFPFVYPGEKL